MKSRIEAIQKRVASLSPTLVIATPGFASTQPTPPITVVGAGIYTDVLHLAGGSNLYGTQNKTYPLISQESFATQKPEIYCGKYGSFELIDECLHRHTKTPRFFDLL